MTVTGPDFIAPQVRDVEKAATCPTGPDPSRGLDIKKKAGQ